MSRFKINKVKLDLTSYPFYVIMGQRKVGKTTLFDGLVKLYTGKPEGGLLISCGDEGGFEAIDNIQVEEALTWDKEPENDEDNRGFVQIVDDLVLNKHDYEIKLVGVDTLDELYRIATEQVYREHRRKYGQFPKSLNDALGGYGAGRDRLKELVVGQLTRLNRAGYAVFVLAHTKSKEKEDVLTGQKYDQITNNLNNDLYGAVADLAAMVVNIITEREIKDNKIVEVKRMMYFRDNGIVDAGGRFKGLPEKLELSPENFMKAFEIGVKSSMEKPIDEKKAEELRQKELAVAEEKRQQLIEEENNSDSERKDELVEKIKDVIKHKATSSNEAKTKIMTKLADLGLSVKELPNASFDVLREFALFLRDI